jgi:tRNA U34 5-methylaminomethyl-2-thiouridine-forming methyltransferase MnmC
MTEKQFLITEDGSHTIFLPELNETYHSTHGAIRESQYVFIEKGLEFIVNTGKKSIQVFEVGFGTGLNALLSLLFAGKHQLSVHYQTVEAYPLTIEDISKLNYAGLIDEHLAFEKFMRLHEAEWNQWVEISIQFQLKKIRSEIQRMSIHEKFDLCYFDAFAPSKQPEMWNIAVLEKVKYLLAREGVLVTYCAKGQLKRDLKSIGFEVETLPGPPGKKEMVRATNIV